MVDTSFSSAVPDPKSDAGQSPPQYEEVFVVHNDPDEDESLEVLFVTPNREKAFEFTQTHAAYSFTSAPFNADVTSTTFVNYSTLTGEQLSVKHCWPYSPWYSLREDNIRDLLGKSGGPRMLSKLFSEDTVMFYGTEPLEEIQSRADVWLKDWFSEEGRGKSLFEARTVLSIVVNKHNDFSLVKVEDSSPDGSGGFICRHKTSNKSYRVKYILTYPAPGAVTLKNKIPTRISWEEVSPKKVTKTVIVEDWE